MPAEAMEMETDGGKEKMPSPKQEHKTDIKVEEQPGGMSLEGAKDKEIGNIGGAIDKKLKEIEDEEGQKMLADIRAIRAKKNFVFRLFPSLESERERKVHEAQTQHIEDLYNEYKSIDPLKGKAYLAFILKNPDVRMPRWNEQEQKFQKGSYESSSPGVEVGHG